MGPWHHSNIVRAPVSWVYYRSILLDPKIWLIFLLNCSCWLVTQVLSGRYCQVYLMQIKMISDGPWEQSEQEGYGERGGRKGRMRRAGRGRSIGFGGGEGGFNGRSREEGKDHWYWEVKQDAGSAKDFRPEDGLTASYNNQWGVN